MESIFHFKAKCILNTGYSFKEKDIKLRRDFSDDLDNKGIPFYLLAQTGHDAHILIRGLTKEKEGIINPHCNTFGVEDVVLKLVDGLNYKQFVFAKDYVVRDNNV